MKQTSHPIISKAQQKITMINFVLCQVRLILFNTNLISKNYFIRENRSEEALNHRELCEIVIQM